MIDMAAIVQYRQNMMKIPVVKIDGRESIGSGFHIGDGYIVTARHVIDGHKKFEVIPERARKAVLIQEVFFPREENIDIALMKTNFATSGGTIHITSTGKTLEFKQKFLLGATLDDWVDYFVLSDILIMGYPPIPKSNEACLVATKGEINAVIDRYDGVKHPHFIVSCIARGGFSGGPCILSDGSVAGVCTEALIRDNQAVETGFSAVIGNEPIFELMIAHKIHIEGNEPDAGYFILAADN